MLDHAAQDADAVGMLEVDGDAALVAVKVLEIGIVARGEIGLVAVGGIALAHLDLDHVGAPVGELARAGRPGARPRQVDHLEAGQRQIAHGCSPASKRPP